MSALPSSGSGLVLWSVQLVQKCGQNSRQDSVVLQFVFQGGKALDDGLALLGLLGVLFSRNSLVHIVDGAGLESVN